MNSVVVLFLLFAGLIAGVLGYGSWHVATHGTFYMDLRDVATSSRFENVIGAQLEFLDDAGKLLARGRSDDKVGVIWVEHPVAGYCGPNLAQAAYATCFKAHSEWLPTWVPNAKRISIAYDLAMTAIPRRGFALINAPETERAVTSQCDVPDHRFDQRRASRTASGHFTVRCSSSGHTFASCA